MALSPRLDLRQSQQLVMTPQLQQAIKLLQLNNIELSSYIAEEVEKNPLLDVGEDRPAETANTDRADAAPADAPGDADTGFEDAPAVADSMSGNGESALDADVSENAFDSDTPSDRIGLDGAPEAAGLSLTGSGAVSGSGGSEAPGGGDNILEETFASELSLQDHLAAQMALILKVP
ncbi:MAG: RNA polymerase sigma-54 factor, partial [Pseudomonadota bacterium]